MAAERPSGFKVIKGGASESGTLAPEAVDELLTTVIARQELLNTSLMTLDEKFSNFVEAQMVHNTIMLECLKKVMAKLDIPQDFTVRLPKKPAARRRR